MPCEPLCEEEIAGCSVDVGYSRVTEGVERIEAIEASAQLPGANDDLNAPAGDTPTRQAAEEWCRRMLGLGVLDLVPAEPAKLRHQGIWYEDVARSPSLRDFWSHTDTGAWCAIAEVDVAYVEANEFA